MEILHRTQREEKGEDLEPVSVFPLVGQHLLDNDDIRTAQTRAAVKCGTRPWTCTESACPLDAERVQWQKPGKHEPFEKSWSLSLASFPFCGHNLGVCS